MDHRAVYIVDDDEHVRHSLAFCLKSLNFAVGTFSGGPEFLSQQEALGPGCVLLDIRMAEMDGFEVIEHLADRVAQLPVVIMTGHGDVATAVRAMKIGACDFIQKPFEERVLLEILERVFGVLSDQARKDERRHAARQRLAGLTAREIDVLRGLASGRSNKVLAFDLGLSTRTVEMHRANMMGRLSVKTLPEALRLAFDYGADVLSLPPTRSSTGFGT